MHVVAFPGQLGIIRLDPDDREVDGRRGHAATSVSGRARRSERRAASLATGCRPAWLGTDRWVTGPSPAPRLAGART
jgi:hypothetical protein